MAQRKAQTMYAVCYSSHTHPLSGPDRLHLLLNRSFEFLCRSNYVLLHLLNGSFRALHRLVVHENASTLDSANDEQAEVDGGKTRRKRNDQPRFCEN